MEKSGTMTTRNDYLRFFGSLLTHCEHGFPTRLVERETLARSPLPFG